jgi:hypothetical protein
MARKFKKLVTLPGFVDIAPENLNQVQDGAGRDPEQENGPPLQRRAALNSPEEQIRERPHMTISDEGVDYDPDAPPGNDDSRHTRQCTRCGTVYPQHLVEWAFRTHLGGLFASSPGYRKRVCRACEQTARDQRKQRDRWAIKARDAIRRHAARLGIDKDKLVTVYGWDPQQLADDAEHQYGKNCSYCNKPYAAMGHGFADITIDIVDRTRPPFYCTNTKWCCQTCNRKKGPRTPEAFEANRQMWNAWERSSNEPPEQLTLF